MEAVGTLHGDGRPAYTAPHVNAHAHTYADAYRRTFANLHAQPDTDRFTDATAFQHADGIADTTAHQHDSPESYAAPNGYALAHADALGKG